MLLEGEMDKSDSGKLIAKSSIWLNKVNMSKPILYIKQGCPWCTDALEYFSKVGLAVELVDVRSNPSRMSELETISGQTKTPTLKNGDFIVADFDVEEFKTALRNNPKEASKLGIVL
jgi:glutaredoxin